MTILVFGAGGQVGREALARGGESVVSARRAEADLGETGAAARLIARVRPAAVINAAAFTAVDRAESERALAFRVNAEAAGEIARAAADAGARLIHLSTDYVFDGSAAGPLAEDAPTGPLSAYGQSKLEGEQRVLGACPGAIVLRTSWVFAGHGANFVRTMLRLAAEKKPLRIVADQRGGPTPAGALADACLALARRDGPGGIYHLQGAPAVSWAEFAKAIFAAAALDATVEPIATANYPTPARRPLYTVLDCSKIARDYGIVQPDWRAHLPSIVAELKGNS